MITRGRITERMLLVANLTVANAVAALWIATFLQPGVLGAELRSEALANAPAVNTMDRALLVPLQTPTAWLAFLGSVGLLLWNFSWLVRRRTDELPNNWIVSETSAGPVRVAREAIEAGLRLAGEALPEITRVRVQVKLPSSKRVAVTGQFHCAEGQNHLAASQRLRQALLERFAELVRLGEGAKEELHLEFQGFLGKLDKNAPEPPAEPEPEPEQFRGPQYPIDDDPQ